MEGKPMEDTDGETMVLIIKLELEDEDEGSFVEPVSSVDELDNDELFRNETERVTLDCELNRCYSEQIAAHECCLQRESRSTNELLTKANASKINETVASQFIKSETFSPTVNQNINLNGNKNISCTNCLEIFPNESSLLMHLDKEHPDFKCGPKVMFVDEVTRDDTIFDFIHKSRIKSEKLEQIARKIKNHRKDESCGNKTIKIECSDSEGHPKVIFVDEVNRDDRIFDFIHKSGFKKGKLEQKLRRIQDQRKANLTGNKTVKNECSDWDGPKPFVCSKCGSIFTTMSQLTSHKQKVHKKKKVDECRYCAYTAKPRHVMKEHEKLHSSENPEVCKWCGKRFKARKTLINHERLHTGETSYQCQYCEKAFVQKSNLNSHFKTCHKDGNIDSQVMPKANLKKEAALVNLLDKKPYICEGCQRPFTFKKNLKRHLKTSCPAVSKENIP